MPQFLSESFHLMAMWVGHACIWTALLNYMYSQPFPKWLLRPWRHFTGLVILSFPAIWLFGAFVPYTWVCMFFGAAVFPLITAARLMKRPPKALVSETTETLDLWKELGPAAIGDGKGRRAAGLPLNCIFRVDFTELTLSMPNLPAELDGLTILHLTDVHYHGTPSRAFHDRIMDEIERRWPTPDLVCLTGDYVDTDRHREWIGPLLGRFRGTEGNFAILGNHDQLHDPDCVRASLSGAGYRVLSGPNWESAQLDGRTGEDSSSRSPKRPELVAPHTPVTHVTDSTGWLVAEVRGVPVLVAGHEGPWFDAPDLGGAPKVAFRIALSHSPDNFRWGIEHGMNLMLCGHVHGGQIRVPIITSIFVPSKYGRRYDMGVFERGGTVMVVGRGLSGKEPLRFRCHPQVMRLTLIRTP